MGRRTGSAWLQSTYAVDSCVSQNSRSSASVLNTGTPFLGRIAPGPPSEIPRFLEVCAVINHSLFAMHISRRNHPNPGSGRAQCKCHVQFSASIRLAQRVEALLHRAVPRIGENTQRCVEENLLGFRLSYTVLLAAFSGIPCIPIETSNTPSFKQVVYCHHIQMTHTAWAQASCAIE